LDLGVFIGIIRVDVTTLDPEQERQRLARLYAGMTPEELQNVAQPGGSLTDAALEALKKEASRRGIDIRVNRAPGGTDQIEERKLVMVRRFRDLPEALLAKGSLNSTGIECFLADDNMVRMDWFISNLIGGIKLLVDEEDAEAATAILDQPIPKTIDVEGVGEYQQPSCPNCESLDVNFEGLNAKIAYTSAYFGVPIPVQQKAWVCHACGHHWQEGDAVK
jgi:hypothetical protein